MRPSILAGRCRLTTRLSLIPLVALALAVPPGALAGPPWITVEYPPNPLDETTRGALLVVHTYHHAALVESEVTAVAEGMVGGERRELSLRVDPTSRPGAYAVRGQLPEEGAWVVVVTMAQGTARASALVALEGGRRLAAVQVPHEMRGRWAIPREATAAEVSAMLRTAEAVARAVGEVRRSERVGFDGRRIPVGLVLAGAGTGLLPLGIGLARRARGRGK